MTRLTVLLVPSIVQLELDFNFSNGWDKLAPVKGLVFEKKGSFYITSLY